MADLYGQKKRPYSHFRLTADRIFLFPITKGREGNSLFLPEGQYFRVHAGSAGIPRQSGRI